MPTKAMLEAATARSGSMRARGDRPQMRRAAEVGGFGVTSAVRAMIQMPPMTDPDEEMPVEPEGVSDDPENDPDDETMSRFQGYASVVNRGYPMWDAFGEYTEVVQPGSFAQTLSQSPDVPLVLGHDSLRRLARTTNGSLQLSEDESGLLCEAQLDSTDPDVAYILPKMRSGLIDEMSFRFTITSGEWSPDWTQYNITAVDIDRGDVSIVGYGANPFTSATVRDAVSKVGRGKRLSPDDVRALDETVDALRLIDPDRLREALERAEAADVIERLEDIARSWRKSTGTQPRMALEDLLRL